MEITVTLVRHGETTANRSKTLQGHMDYKLNTNGQTQAIKAGEWLRNHHFDDVYSSDLSRAFDTAAAIVIRNKSINNINLIRRWEMLRERTFGVMEGKSFETFAQEARKSGFVNETSLWNYTPEGGESLEELRERAAVFFDTFIDHLAALWNPGQKPEILLVTHGVIIKELMIHLFEERNCTMMNNSNNNKNSKNYRSVCPNTGLTKLVLKYDENKRFLGVFCKSLYETHHLKGMEALSIENLK